jgi:hypothetical protein
MSKRFSNKTLFVILGILAALLAFTIIIRIPRENATLKSKLVEFDTLKVDKIIVHSSSGKGEAIEFMKKPDGWKVKQGEIESPTRSGAVESIYNEFINLKPKSLAAVNKEKWEEFELTDSLATRVQFLDSRGKNLCDILVGKFSYKQVGNPYGGYGNNNIQGTTYVRIHGEKEVYSVDGFLAMFFSGGFDSWRDKTFVHSNKDDILTISFVYPADSSYTLELKDSAWFAGNIQADSLKVANYLRTLSNLNGREIRDNYKPVRPPAYQLMVQGNNLLNLNVKCFIDETSGGYVLNSNLNPEVYYSSTRESLFSSLFKPVSFFTGKK